MPAWLPPSPKVGAVDRLVDFGCGGGFLLDRLPAREKIGIEVNEVAARDARAKGIQVFASLDQVGDASVDVIMSHHALEHVDHPLDIVTTMQTGYCQVKAVAYKAPSAGAAGPAV